MPAHGGNRVFSTLARCCRSRRETTPQWSSLAAAAALPVARAAQHVVEAAPDDAALGLGVVTAPIAGPRGSHPLAGVRLGRMERDLLLRAPGPQTLFGLELDASDRSVREQTACVIEASARGPPAAGEDAVYGRARDPRREGLLLRDGCFYRRTDPSRAHAVRRNVVWLSPFGLRDRPALPGQLRSGAAIRWDARIVERARSQARKHSVDRRAQRIEIAASEEDERDAVVLGEAARPGLESSFPTRSEPKATEPLGGRRRRRARPRAPSSAPPICGKRPGGCLRRWIGKP